MYSVFINNKEYSIIYRNRSREIVNSFASYIKAMPSNRNKIIEVKQIAAETNRILFNNLVTV